MSFAVRRKISHFTNNCALHKTINKSLGWYTLHTYTWINTAHRFKYAQYFHAHHTRCIIVTIDRQTDVWTFRRWSSNTATAFTEISLFNKFTLIQEHSVKSPVGQGQISLEQKSSLWPTLKEWNNQHQKWKRKFPMTFVVFSLIVFA